MENRDTYLRDVLDEHPKVDRDAAKTLFLLPFFAPEECTDIYSYWCKLYKLVPNTEGYSASRARYIANDIDAIRRRIPKRFSGIAESVKGTDGNVTGTAAALLLSERGVSCDANCPRMAKEHGFKIGTYIHDGCLVEKGLSNNIPVDELNASFAG